MRVPVKYVLRSSSDRRDFDASEFVLTSPASKGKCALAALVLATGVGFGVALWQVATEQRPNVILIVVDTLRADHLSAYGYERRTSPVLDAFAAENLHFDFAIATAPWTAPSVASIFTGLYPAAHGVNRHVEAEDRAVVSLKAAALSEGFLTLAEAVKANGYRTAGITGNAWVADDLGFAQGFDEFSTLDYQPAVDINRRAFRTLDALAEQDDPFLLYVHYMDPHTPYRPPKSHPQRFTEPLLRPVVASQRERIDLYDAEIHYLDSQIGLFFDRLRELDLYKDAVIVVVSDHGEQFKEHGNKGHGHNAYHYQLHVPLFLKAGGLRGRVRELVSIADIYPTLLELTSTEPESVVEGVSLLSDSIAKRDGVFSEVTRGVNHKAFTRSDGKKLILGFDAKRGAIVADGQESRVVGLFDLHEDYFESRSMEDSSLLDEMRRGFYETYRDSVELGLSAQPEEAELDEQTIKRLKNLGYLE